MPAAARNAKVQTLLGVYAINAATSLAELPVYEVPHTWMDDESTILGPTGHRPPHDRSKAVEPRGPNRCRALTYRETDRSRRYDDRRHRARRPRHPQRTLASLCMSEEEYNKCSLGWKPTSQRESLVGARKILTVGLELPGMDAEYVPLSSNRSLLDADIVVFEPSITGDSNQSHNGKPLLNEESSADEPVQLSHWNAEIRSVLSAGKLVVVFLDPPDEVFVYTGQKQFSGTGRSRATTNLVRQISSYESLPFVTKASAKTGTQIVPNGKIRYFAPFWAEFREYFESYYVWIEGKFHDVLLQTKTGGHVVGSAVRQNGGAILYLPLIRYKPHKKASAKSKKTRGLTEVQFGKKFVSALVAIAEVLAKEDATTPQPTWAGDAAYRLSVEDVLSQQLGEANRRLAEIQTEICKLNGDLTDAGTLRRLLYEQGKPLERAVLESLRLFGFAADPFQRWRLGIRCRLHQPRG